MRRCLLALVTALAAATAAPAQQDKDKPLITKGPFELYQVIENRRILGQAEQNAKGNHRNVYFPQVPWSPQATESRYQAIMATEVPDAKVGDVIDIRCMVTVIQRGFIDFRTGKPGSAFCPSEISVHTAVPPDDGKMYGTRLWPASGENVSEHRVYYQPKKDAVFVVQKTPVVVLFWLYPSSAGARGDQFLQVPTTSSYNVTYIMHYRKAGGGEAAPAKGARGGSFGPGALTLLSGPVIEPYVEEPEAEARPAADEQRRARR